MAAGYWDTITTNAYLASRNVNPYGRTATAGTILTIGGGVMQAIGAFADAQNSKNQLKTQALSAEFEATMAAQDARAAEKDAQAILEAGQTEIGRLGQRYAQEKAAQRTSAAGAGVRVGTGSSAEALASTELAKAIDARTINQNTLQQVNAARTRGTNARNASLLAGVSARNLRRTAGSIQPLVGAAAGLIGTGGAVASQWVASRRAEFYGSRAY